MGFLSFTSWTFAAVGALCALGPIIIHLLNRRRHRVVKWAAMDFLRQALERNRRILQIRDILLLILRTAAVLLFGLALARPYFATQQEAFDDKQPLHAVLVIDNSLSMAYESLEGSLLDQAKERARQLIEMLPAGSRISLVPACGSRAALSVDPYDAKESALEALDQIEIVDRSANLVRSANDAQRACQAAPELAKRVVFFGDQQERNWQDVRQTGVLEKLPAMQVVDVSPGQWENTWIADLRLQDGLADMETPATVVVALAHQGSGSRRDLQVMLSLGETVLGQKTVTVEPGLGTREVDFECVFNNLTELPAPDRPVFVTLRASIEPDRLAADDERFLAVPVVAALPVVFVDQYGPNQEDVVRGRLGETRHLRKLLAPRTSRSDAPRQLVNVRHITPAELTQEILADARLVVVAGIAEPGEMAALLRDYVLQGGQLVLAAGAEFDPSAWNVAAWQEGTGILPLPLADEPIGQTPEASGENLKPFHLSFGSLAGEDYFQLANVAEAELRDLYAEPFFFKAVRVDDSDAALAAAEQAKAASAPAPVWLVWAAEARPADDAKAQANASERKPSAQRPRVLARYDLPGQPPFLVARQIGRGQVVFCSTGLLSSWNTLPKTNAVLMFDRILRGMIESTLPGRNLSATDRLQLPLPSGEQNLLVSLARPGRANEQEPIDVGYLDGDQRGVTLTGLLERGVYRITGVRPAVRSTSAAASDKPVWDVPLVVNGEAEESDLTPLGENDLAAIPGAANVRWVGAGEEISLTGTAVRGQSSWWWLALFTLLLLLLEMSVLAWPMLAPGSAAAPSPPP